MKYVNTLKTFVAVAAIAGFMSFGNSTLTMASSEEDDSSRWFNEMIEVAALNEESDKFETDPSLWFNQAIEVAARNQDGDDFETDSSRWFDQMIESA